MSNQNLLFAGQNPSDEYYTRPEDIEKEILPEKHGYINNFKNKIIYMNCDNPEFSAFWHFFKKNFTEFKLKKIISTYFAGNGSSFKTEYDGINELRTTLSGNGDFRSDECVEILKNSDIVVTNEPFSLFRDFIKLIKKYNKKFLIIANKNAITYKDFYPMFLNNNVKTGFTTPKYFTTPNGISSRVNGLCYWFTNLNINTNLKTIKLTKKYSPDLYVKYDNYDAVNCDRISDIPKDYKGLIGVPVTFLLNIPDNFKIIKFRKGNDGKDLRINNRSLYFRIIVECK